MSTRSPNPGSKDAREAGCRCPVMDNSYGAGYYGQAGFFVMSEDCPLHGLWAKVRAIADRVCVETNNEPDIDESGFQGVAI